MEKTKPKYDELRAAIAALEPLTAVKHEFTVSQSTIHTVLTRWFRKLSDREFVFKYRRISSEVGPLGVGVVYVLRIR